MLSLSHSLSASAPCHSLKRQRLLRLFSALRKVSGKMGDWPSYSRRRVPPDFRESPPSPQAKSTQTTMHESDEPCSPNARYDPRYQNGRHQRQQMFPNMKLGKQGRDSSYVGRRPPSADKSPKFVYVAKESSLQRFRPPSGTADYADPYSYRGGQCHVQVAQESLVDASMSEHVRSCSPPSGNECSIQDAHASISEHAGSCSPLSGKEGLTQDALVNVVTPLVERTEGDEADSRGQIDSNPQVGSPVREMYQKDEHILECKTAGNPHQDGQQNVQMLRNEFGFGGNKLEHESFDICLKTTAAVKLNPSLLSMNKEKRKIAERNKMGVQGRALRSGMILLEGYLSHSEQVEIIKECRELGLGSGGFYKPGYNHGAKLRLQMMCLGKNWDPEWNLYGDTRAIDGAKPASIPDRFKVMVESALQSAQQTAIEDVLPSMKPDICIVNFYTNTGKLGLHKDKDESKQSLDAGLPVVSFSIGDSAEFLYGDERNVEKAEKVILKSGDVLIFGGKSRHVFHGVSSILPDTAPKLIIDETHLRPGRLNLTFRQY